MPRINLGDFVQDEVSGIKGIAIARTFWLHGCERILIQPKAAKNADKQPEGFSVDEPQVVLLKAGVVKNRAFAPEPTHGDRRDYTSRHETPRR